MRTARFALALCCCVAVGLTGVAGVAGAPPPSQICGVCGPGIANDAEIAGATGHGTLDIYIDETGDSRWSARVPINASAVERYRTNASALAAAVDDAWARYHAADGDVGSVDPSLRDDTVVVNYTVTDVARRGVGDAWIVDYFATGTSPTRYEVVADRVTIHSPDGTVVTNRIPLADVDGNTATWTNETERDWGEDFDDQTYVTYGSDGVVGTASGYATIGLADGPAVLVRGLANGLIPGALIGLAGVAIGRAGGGRPAVDAVASRLGFRDVSTGVPTLERLLVGVGVLGAVGILVVDALTTSRALTHGAVVLSSLGVGYALLGATAARIGDRLHTRGLVGLAALATLTAAGYTLLLTGALAYPLPLLFGFATALFLPIGFAFERDRTPIGLLAVVALVPTGAIVLVYPMSALDFWTIAFGTLLFLPWVAVVALFGAPLALLGRRLATARD
ncbi:hypothetical protein [Natrinema caseinilyticum]|uniref:hypothetical protein n=1 Tax=Natrinema caseinilyticum TaxID=2961570 RepID=UPI0020C27F82|nr:hypothetical protein [Natrinema caseinilyticum]